jgi:hypothetical protein
MFNATRTMKKGWFTYHPKPSMAFFVNRIMVINNGNNSGNARIATNAALLLALDTIPDTSVSVLESPTHPKKTPSMNCGTS